MTGIVLSLCGVPRHGREAEMVLCLDLVQRLRGVGLLRHARRERLLQPLMEHVHLAQVCVMTAVARWVFDSVQQAATMRF